MGSKSYSKGISWFNDCRIPFVDEGENNLVFNRSGKGGFREKLVGCEIKEEYKWKQGQGRFPANLLVCDDMLNDGVITKQNPRKYKADLDIQETSLLGFGDTKDKIQMGDSGSSSRYYNIDKWYDNIISE